jgi:hypothetical protein
MPFPSFFKADGAAAEPSPEELRREERRLQIREEQAAARLGQALADSDRAFEQGASARSLSLRRILARRFAALSAERDALEQELLRLGKDLVTVRALLASADAGRKAKVPQDSLADLQVAYEDDRVGEAAYRESLFKALGRALPEHDPVREVFEAWRGLDAGRHAGLAAARAALEAALGRGEK